MKVASIGECMVEFSDAGARLFSRAFGGDTLNTALYLARLGIETSYITALGDDPLSSAMLEAWSAEGIHLDEVLRLPGRLPGLYMIERNTLGERSFLYWRDRAPAREFFDLVDDVALERLAHFDWIYLSGITLSLYSESGRARLVELLTKARRNGGRVAFDGNYRPRGWSDAATARLVFNNLLPHVDLALPTIDDEQLLFGDADADSCAARRWNCRDRRQDGLARLCRVRRRTSRRRPARRGPSTGRYDGCRRFLQRRLSCGPHGRCIPD